MLEGDRAKLLFQKYDNRLGGGKVILSPCTIIFLSDGPAENDSERIRQSIVLQAKEAILQFEHDLQLVHRRLYRLSMFVGCISSASQGHEFTQGASSQRRQKSGWAALVPTEVE